MWNHEILFVPPKSKVNGEYFITEVLTPLVKEDIPRLHPRERRNAVLQFNSAPGHAGKKTVKWLEANNIRYIPKEGWPGNSPDLCPMDF